MSDYGENYAKITDLYFAVWNMYPPINFIWIDFKSGTLKIGERKKETDGVADYAEAVKKASENFIELISYDSTGKPILNFEGKPSVPEEPCDKYLLDRNDLATFLVDMEDVGLLDWKPQYPSLREGQCWRIDIYMRDGEKHYSGQTRYPERWADFGRSLGGLVNKARNGTKI